MPKSRTDYHAVKPSDLFNFRDLLEEKYNEAILFAKKMSGEESLKFIGIQDSGHWAWESDDGLRRYFYPDSYFRKNIKKQAKEQQNDNTKV